jgi:hypothetical protein
MANFPITLVRHNEEQSRQLLSAFVFGGRYGGFRVPRGVSPDFVSKFIRKELSPDSPPDAYARTLQVLRYYECSDVLPHLGQILNGREKDATDVLRSAYVLQAMGDLGSPQDRSQAGVYFDEFLVAHASLAPALYQILCETLIVLAPAVSTAKLRNRLTTEVRALTPQQGAGEAALMQYDKLAAVQRNDLPSAVFAVEVKNGLVGLTGELRNIQLVRTYLGLAPGGEPLESWAARALRKEAMNDDPDQVRAAFASELDNINVPTVSESRAKFIVVRAAQAIIYFGGTLTAAQSQFYEKSLPGAANFLWDW